MPTPNPPKTDRRRVPRRLLDTAPARILTRAECEALFTRITSLTSGGGDTIVSIRSTWTRNIRWARNRPTTLGDTVECIVTITRVQPFKFVMVELDRLDDATLKEAVQVLEKRLAELQPSEDARMELLPKQDYLPAATWSEATYTMSTQQLSEAARMSVDPVVDAQLDAAGYGELGATARAVFNTRGLNAYATATGAMYSETVRNEAGTASGWAGRAHMDWAMLDPTTLSKTALERCIKSANPSAVEPGRYTAILDPDIVGRMMSFAVEAMNRDEAETNKTVYTLTPPHGNQRGTSKIGMPVFDRAITITSDPGDPDCGYIPFDPDGTPYAKTTWVEKGVLKALAYDRAYAKKYLGSETALLNPQAFRVSGGETSLDEMIASTERGIYVTHSTGLGIDDDERLTLTCVTRDGLWLIEHGKLTRPIKNLWINDSPMVVFNQIAQIGPAVRTYGAVRQILGSVLRDLPSRALNDGHTPIVAPSMKVKDFNFTRLSEAI